jgi:hypothetical protein
MWSEDIKEALVATFRALRVMVVVILMTLVMVTAFLLTSPLAYAKWPDGISDMRKDEVRDGMWVTLVCEQWEEGYFDGFCALQKYGCMAPAVAPLCPWQDFRTTRQAYHRGYAKGGTDYIIVTGQDGVDD